MSLTESRQNPKFKVWLSLLESRGIKTHGLTIIAGQKLVDEFLAHKPDQAQDLLLPIQIEPPTDLPDQVRIHTLATTLFKELDVFGTNTPLLVVSAPEIPAWNEAKPSGLELVVALSDPGNLGALLRTAEAMGVRKVILTREACSPYLPKTIRASSGASLRLQVERAGSIREMDSLYGYCLDMHGTPIQQFAWPQDVLLVLGEEGRGIPESFELKRISIPMNGPTESLNATTAAAIAMYSYRQKHDIS